MSTLTSEQAQAMQRKRRRNGTRNPRAELREIQAILLRDIRDPKTAPHIRAQCARAFNDCEERIRIITGKPLPGQLRPDLAQRPNRKPRRALLSIAPADLPTQSQQSSNASS